MYVKREYNKIQYKNKIKPCVNSTLENEQTGEQVLAAVDME